MDWTIFLLTWQPFTKKITNVRKSLCRLGEFQH